MKTVEQLNRETDPAYVRAYGAIRRFVITLTDRAIWQIAGVMMPDGLEAKRAELFGGIGFFARPPADNEAEAIVAMGGDANNPIIIAARDEKTRAAVAGDLKPDESAMFNSRAIVKATVEGKIEARSPTGIAGAVATNSDLAALVNILATWTTVPNDGGAALKAAINAYLTANPDWPAGTRVLRGE